jgi:hypothetical protein
MYSEKVLAPKLSRHLALPLLALRVRVNVIWVCLYMGTYDAPQTLSLRMLRSPLRT